MIRCRQPDRGMALIAVLLVMGGAMLAATSLLFMAQARMASTVGTSHRVQAQALGWSGVQVAIVNLNGQRETILAGDTPSLDEQYTIYETPDRLGVVRLLAIGPDGERLVPEAGKLDVNSIDADTLAATELIDPVAAAAVIDYRDTTLQRPYQSIGELLDVGAVSAADLYGPVGEPFEDDDAPGIRGLNDVLTVYSFEPALQRNGRLRINLNVPWSEELGERVAERFGEDAAQTLGRIMESGTTFEDETRIYQVLRFFQVPMEDWPDIIDAFTSEEGDLHFGRLDINTAPYEALAALPGLEPEQAAQIVQLRDELTADQRSTAAWLAVEGVVEPQQYDLLGGRITTRSWSWRLRLAAGEVDADAPEGDLQNPIVYDAVIDLSAPRPRIAYLREVTWLDTATRIAAGVVIDDEEAWAPEELDEPEPPEATETDPDDLPDLEQPDDPEPVSPGGEEPDPTAAPTPQPQRTRIGRWTAG